MIDDASGGEAIGADARQRPAGHTPRDARGGRGEKSGVVERLPRAELAGRAFVHIGCNGSQDEAGDVGLLPKSWSRRYESWRRASAVELSIMKRKRHTPEEIIKKLREAATLLAGGQGVEEVCKKLEVSPPTYHRWRQEYGGAKEETVKRLKELEKENGRLKKLVADLSLDKAILKEIAEGKW